MVRFNAKEAILATPNFVFMVSRPEHGWRIDFDSELTERQYRISYQFAIDTFNKQISSYEIGCSDKDALIIHYLWMIFFEMNYIQYVRKKNI